MSRKERERIAIMVGIKRQELTLVQAAQLMGLSYRQSKRVWRRYRLAGDAGLVHRLRGAPSLRRHAPELRARVLARCDERYPDFGPTLAAEYLEAEGLVVDHETLRRWLIAEGTRTVRRRRQRHRQWRERKPCLGQMVQLDGSHHDWFEGRRGRCVLMVMVDDATGRLWAQFHEEETTRASYGVLQDRLVKALRLAGISDLESANRFLGGTFLPAFNRKFNVQAASQSDAHRGVPRELDEALSWESGRVVQRDWTVSHAGQWYQVDRHHEALSLAGKPVIVRTLRDGRVQLEHRGRKLKWRQLPGRPQRVQPERARMPRVKPMPVANHPWRRLDMVGREYWRKVKASGRALRAAARLEGRDSGRPLQPEKQSNRQQPTKGTFSRELNRGHF